MTARLKTALRALGDVELAQLCAARDESALRHVITANNQRLFRAAWSILKDRADAEEAVQSAASVFVSRWSEIAHAAQLPPDGAWSTWLFQGGRGAGKTRAGAEWLAARAEARPGLYALVGPTQHDVREVMVDVFDQRENEIGVQQRVALVQLVP